MQKRTVLRAAAAAVGGALLASACSSGGGSVQQSDSPISVRPVAGSGATSGHAPDACALVSTADASALFGHPATQSLRGQQGEGVCAWNASGNLPDGAILEYSLVAHAYDGTSAYTEKIASGRRVAHVGQRAYTYRAGSTDTIETVDHNKTVVLIYAVHAVSGGEVPSTPDKDAKLKALARTAASRL